MRLPPRVLAPIQSVQRACGRRWWRVWRLLSLAARAAAPTAGLRVNPNCALSMHAILFRRASPWATVL